LSDLEWPFHASRAISAVAELFVKLHTINAYVTLQGDQRWSNELHTRKNETQYMTQRSFHDIPRRDSPLHEHILMTMMCSTFRRRLCSKNDRRI